MDTKKFDVKKLTYLAILTALVIVFQLIGRFIQFTTFPISLVLVPIAIGGMICGMIGGAWLGFVFSIVVLVTGASEPFFSFNPVATISLVILKGTACGFVSGLIYKLFKKYDTVISSYAAAFVCPIVNTGIFIIGCYAIFLNNLSGIEGYAKYGNNTKFIFLGLAGANFISEMLITLALSPAIVRIVTLFKDGKEKNQTH